MSVIGNSKLVLEKKYKDNIIDGLENIFTTIRFNEKIQTKV